MSNIWSWQLLAVAVGIIVTCPYVMTFPEINSRESDKETPDIIMSSKYFLEGETFSLNCMVLYKTNSAVKLIWSIPRAESIEGRHGVKSNEEYIEGNILYSTITITNATINDAGNYTCTSSSSSSSGHFRMATVEKQYKGKKGFAKLEYPRSVFDGLIKTMQTAIRLQYVVNAYPPANFMWLRDGKKLKNDKEKYKITVYDNVFLQINFLTIEDSGNYTMVASNGYETSNLTYDVRVKAAPVVQIGPQEDSEYLLGLMVKLMCEAIGYPLPKIKWVFTDESGEDHSYENTNTYAESLIRVFSLIEIPVQTSGNITCHAYNDIGNNSAIRKFLVHDISGGFGVKNADKAWFSEGQHVSIECFASKYDFLNVRWIRDDNKSRADTVPGMSSFSLIATLEIQKISINDEGNYTCIGKKYDDSFERQTVFITVADENVMSPTPVIIRSPKYFLEGETFSLNCMVIYKFGSVMKLIWNIPRQESIEESHGIKSNEQKITGGILYTSITITNATVNDAGTYRCTSTNLIDPRVATVKKQYIGKEGIVKLKYPRPYGSIGSDGSLIEAVQLAIRLQYVVDAYPPANFICLRDGEKLKNDAEKYKITVNDNVFLQINSLTVEDSGNYTMVASNEYNTSNLTYDVRVKAAPVVRLIPEEDREYLLGLMTKLKCEAIGYPLPNINWVLIDESGEEHSYETTNIYAESMIRVSSLVEIPVETSGNITCHAYNNMGNSSASKEFIVHEISGGFGVKNADKVWFSEGQNVSMACYASKYDFLTVKWIKDENKSKEEEHTVPLRISPFSLIATLEIQKISIDDEGNYTCIGEKNNKSMERQTVFITVAAMRRPTIAEPKQDVDREVKPYLSETLYCLANAVPPPNITWCRDGEVLENDSNVNHTLYKVNDSTVNATITVKPTLEDNYNIKYECVATSGAFETRRSYNLSIKEKSPFNFGIYLGIIGVILFFLFLLIIYLMWKVRKEKQFRKELAAAGLLYFKEGVTRSLNPDLGIDEQAELLPYDERFEYPADKLVLGKQLGSGAFGVVYKAEAQGIINADETTPVAVKMVKKTADNMHIKALVSELKIMVHLGKHVNLVNLLGACTKNVWKRELIVIVEYCKFGNIHNYMQKHREVFIDQLTDNKEKNRKEYKVLLSQSNGMQSDCLASNRTEDKNRSFVNTTDAVKRFQRNVSEADNVQPEWRNLRPLTSRDLLVWAFQVARGMEYLANRKVLHGDLAARNILLAEDNIVKICDFGLARSIGKNDEYKKQENGLLPFKWVAIECMTDRIFSTQSDVWSFGIVLWELFSLAKTPYPNVSPTSLVHWLSDGHRLEKPQYADNNLYEVMLRCWQQKPTARPTFGQLQEILGTFLDDNVRNHYVDFNKAYMDMNAKREEQEDYLAMMSAPDYNNMATSSPHQYENETKSFIPRPPAIHFDDENYPQKNLTYQSILSPRAQSAKSDFDMLNLNNGTPNPNQRSDLTPLLTLKNIPAFSGSNSDFDVNESPYLQISTRIERDTDKVFKPTQHTCKNSQNNQNTAVTNLTYITYDGEFEKTPQNISINDQDRLVE